MTSFTSLDIDRLRAETPGCATVIHFNNAGASLMPLPVYQATMEHMALEQTIGGYEAEAAAEPALNDFYDAFAALLNCDRSEIAYVENATRAWDMAFYALPFNPGDRVLTVESEFVSNYLAFLHRAKHLGLEIDVAPCDSTGQVDVDAMERMVTPRTKLISMTHIPTQGGLVNPAEEVGRIAQRHGITYLLDACQSAGQMPLDVKKIGCHLLTGTGRKYLRGPRATGFLFASKAIMDQMNPPFIDMHAARWRDRNTYQLMPDARRFENWEMYVAGRVGLRAAVRYALSVGIDNIRARVAALAGLLSDNLTAIPGVRVHDLGRTKSGAVTFFSKYEPPNDMRSRLRAANINVSVSEGSSAVLDFGRRGLAQLVRASVHYYNTEDEVRNFCHAVSSTARK